MRLGNSWLARVQGDNVLVIRPALAAARWAAFVALSACSFTPSSPAPVERMPPVPHTCHFPPNVALALAVHTTASELQFGQALGQEPDAPGIAYVTAGQIELPGSRERARRMCFVFDGAEGGVAILSVAQDWQPPWER